MKIEDFLMDRLTELESENRMAFGGGLIGERMFEMVNKSIFHSRTIVEWHKNWPVLVEHSPVLTQSSDGVDANAMTFTMVQELQWLTQRAYVERFGTAPPTASLLMQMANQYTDHPDFQEEWRL